MRVLAQAAVAHDAFVQYGALGILGWVVFWLTKKFNGKVDRLANALQRLADILEGTRPDEHRHRSQS